MAKKRYRVIGDSVVAGHEPGEEFEFDFDEGFNEAALLEGGHIEVVGGKAKPKEAKEE